MTKSMEAEREREREKGQHQALPAVNKRLEAACNGVGYEPSFE